MDDSRSRRIYVTSMELKRLKDIVETVRFSGDEDHQVFETLAGELENAAVGPETEAPANVITLGSRVRIRNMETEEVRELLLTFPSEASGHEDRLSVLEPMGAAALGRVAGDVFTCRIEGSETHYRVEEVLYQQIDCELA